MKTHFSHAEFVDWLDGTLPAARAAHAEACATCRSRGEQLRLDLGAIRSRGEEVPEPSPLFWEHLSQRVSEAVRQVDPHPGVRAWSTRPLWTLAGSAIAAAVAIALWTTLPYLNPAERTQERARATEHSSSPQEAASLALDHDDEWALVRLAADDLEWEDAPEAGLTARPGAAERVALEMSPEERQELARLLEDALKRTGA